MQTRERVKLFAIKLTKPQASTETECSQVIDLQNNTL